MNATNAHPIRATVDRERKRRRAEGLHGKPEILAARMASLKPLPIIGQDGKRRQACIFGSKREPCVGGRLHRFSPRIDQRQVEVAPGPQALWARCYAADMDVRVPLHVCEQERRRTDLGAGREAWNRFAIEALLAVPVGAIPINMASPQEAKALNGTALLLRVCHNECDGRCHDGRVTQGGPANLCIPAPLMLSRAIGAGYRANMPSGAPRPKSSSSRAA